MSTVMLLANVLTTGYSIKSSKMTAIIEKLSQIDRERIYDVVDTMIHRSKQ